jgi:hypothetical protein
MTFLHLLQRSLMQRKTNALKVTALGRSSGKSGLVTARLPQKPG